MSVDLESLRERYGLFLDSAGDPMGPCAEDVLALCDEVQRLSMELANAKWWVKRLTSEKRAS